MSRRTDRLAKLMQQHIGQLLLKGLADPRIDPARTSVTRVAVQEDLLRAKVYVSVLGTEADERRTLEALRHAAGHIRTALSREIDLRTMPALEFLHDERFKGTLKTWALIAQANEEIRARQEAKGSQEPSPEEPSDEAAAPGEGPGEEEESSPT